MGAGVKTAIIMAAGNGSRRMPLTRAIDKAMIPIGNRPTIDYVVEQCAEADIERIVFVVSSPDTLIKRYYEDGLEIADEYPWLNKTGRISTEYVVQDMEAYGYGSGSAVACAQASLADEDAFAVLAADGFIYGSDKPVVKTLIEAYESDGNVAGSVAGFEVSDAEVKYYSLIKHTDDMLMTDLIEKPDIQPVGKLVPANVSYYVLSRDVFDIITHLAAHNGEYYLTDAVLGLAQQKGIKVAPIQGLFLDSGRVEPWLEANKHIVDNK